MSHRNEATANDGGEAGGFGRFFLPGPTEVRPKVLEAQARPMIGHRGREIEELIEELQPGLKALFGTERPVVISTSSATGLMEAAVRNGARRRLLALVNGAFAKRFAKIGEACDVEVDTYEVEWGETHDPAEVARRVEEAADAGDPFDAITLVHSETSTGALNPLKEISRAVRGARGGARGELMILVDSVTGVGGAEVKADEWELDFVLTGSQKAMALPPGLAFGVASEPLLERGREAPAKGVYFDLNDFYERLEKSQTPNTPGVSLLYALRTQLQDMARETVEGRLERHRAMAERTYRWVEETASERGIPLRILTAEGDRSPTVTCIMLPEGVTGPQVVAGAKERGFVVGGGYGKLKNDAFRIGHMGDHTVEELDALLEVLDDVLQGLTRSRQAAGAAS